MVRGWGPGTAAHAHGRRLLHLSILLGLVALLAVSPAQASPGPIGFTTRTIATQDQVWRLDLATGVSTFVAATGLPAFTSLAFAPNSTLYGVNVTNSNLYRIDPSTATPTLIGPLGITTTGGQLTATGNGQLWFMRGSPSSLFRVSASTGQATLVGPIGQGSVSGIAGTCYGRLFGYSNGNLLSIDSQTGAGSVIGATGLGSNNALRIALDEKGHLWGVLFTPAQWDKVYLLNKWHGTATFVAQTSGNFNTLALPHPCHG